MGAGKGTVVEYLRTQRQFAYFSVRQFLMEEVHRRGMEPNRDSLTFVANDLRQKHSPSYIVDELYKQAVEHGGNAIIESIRAVGEVESLRKKGSFVLVAVDAKPELRYERIQKRGSETDHIDFETFLANEKREMENTDPNKQNLKACMRMADIRLENNGSFDDLHHEIDRFLENLQDDAPKHERPSWDEYFMDLCHSVALRATCNRGRSGCVIVKDKQILVTGYVGSPSHLPHCDEVGHLFRKILHEDGTITTHCVRTVHAEQNAILGRQHLVLHDDPLPHLRDADYQLRHQEGGGRIQVPCRSRIRGNVQDGRRGTPVRPRRGPAVLPAEIGFDSGDVSCDT